MKLSVKKLRGLINEALNEAGMSDNRRFAKEWERMQDMKRLGKKYPKTWELFIKHEQDPMSAFQGNIDNKPNPVKELEKLVVYKVMTTVGSDIDVSKLGRMLPKLRKVAQKLGHSNLLDAYEKKTLEDVLDQAGMFGSSSDKLRDPSDRFY